MTYEEKKELIREAWRLAHVGKFKDERVRYVKLCVRHNLYGRLKYAISTWGKDGQKESLP